MHAKPSDVEGRWGCHMCRSTVQENCTGAQLQHLLTIDMDFFATLASEEGPISSVEGTGVTLILIQMIGFFGSLHCCIVLNYTAAMVYDGILTTAKQTHHTATAETQDDSW